MSRAAEPGGDAPAGSETVLVVEDDEAVRQFTRAVLMAAGYQVLSAADGNEAMTLARSHTGLVHLLITDVVMPVLDGHALADQFHAKAVTATIRAHLINVAARVARSARRTTLRLPTNWPWATAWQQLFDAAIGPPAAI